MNTMNGTALTLSRNEATILAHYAAGESISEIARNTNLDRSLIATTIGQIAKSNRNLAHNLAVEYQKRASAVAAARGVSGPPAPRIIARPPANASPAPVPGGIAEVLAEAENSGMGRLVRAAEKIRALVDDLRQQLTEHAREAELRAQVDGLAAQLAAAKDELRNLTGRRPAYSPPANTEVLDWKAIRRWAADNGIDCPAAGRVPGRVVDAWRAAQ